MASTQKVQPVPPALSETRRQAAPAGLIAEINQLWRNFPGKTGIAVKRIDGEWLVSERGDEWFPQQSVSKLWVAMAMFDRIDRGQASLNDQLTITPDNLVVFYQPLASRVQNEGRVTMRVAELLEQALARSDNLANDSLLDHIGGPEAVRSFIRSNGLGRIRFGPGERLLQAGIAGVEWRQELSYGRRFQAERAQLPYAYRRQKLEEYLADPIDGASPVAIVEALARLAREDMLSSDSSRRMMSILSRTKSGPNRLKAGVPAGWQFMHKTGTGQVLDALATGYNDVGIMTAPDGTRYAVAVMLSDTTASVPARMEMMQSVTRAVARYHVR